ARDPVWSLDGARDADAAREPATPSPDGFLRAAPGGGDPDQERAGLTAAPGPRRERGGSAGAALGSEESVGLGRSDRRPGARSVLDDLRGVDLRRAGAQRALSR